MKGIGLQMLMAVLAVRAGLAQDSSRLTLMFVGDIMQHQSQLDAAYDPATESYDYEPCFRYIAPILSSADLTFANLELTLPGKGYSGYPQFGAPDALAAEIKRAGVDVLVTANNHSVDKGRKGIERTIRVLDSLGFSHTGTFRDSADRSGMYPLLVEKNGFRLALLNYSYGTNGIPVPKPTIVNLIDTTQIRIDLLAARGLHPDKVIVFFHWGNEYQRSPSSDQKRLAAFCYSHGADIIIGAHPHVLQPMEWDRSADRFTAWSLGNFVSGQRPRYRDGGAIGWLRLAKTTGDSAGRVRIDSAGYLLEWVHKGKDFHILPVHNFEQDTILVSTAAARQALATFRDDSRSLLNSDKHAPRELVWDCELADRFRIQLATSHEPLNTDSVANALSGLSPLVHIEKSEDGYSIQVEDLDDEDIARVWAEDIRNRTPYASATVVRQSAQCPEPLRPARR
jgi:poly-gamma-glutamate synthesis protein (capsule biosynthesis protein)